jgi:hypothetical protein
MSDRKLGPGLHRVIDLTLTPWRWLTLSVKHDIVCLIDAEDEDWLRQWNWNYGWHVRTRWKLYAKRNIGAERSTIYLARELMLYRKPPASLDLVVDHINGQSLDNRKANLRWVTQEKNKQNQVGEFLCPKLDEIVAGLIEKKRQGAEQLAEVPF